MTGMQIDTDAFVAQFRQAVDLRLRQAEQGMAAFGELVLADAFEDTPMEIGDLRRSGMSETVRDDQAITTAVGFGTGSAAPYAIVQHERTDYRHKVGRAKYLELAVMAWRTRLQSVVARFMR